MCLGVVGGWGGGMCEFQIFYKGGLNFRYFKKRGVRISGILQKGCES